LWNDRVYIGKKARIAQQAVFVEGFRQVAHDLLHEKAGAVRDLSGGGAKSRARGVNPT
jgi:hypothetical protein